MRWVATRRRWFLRFNQPGRRASGGQLACRSWAASPPNLILPNRQANQAGFYGSGQIWSVGGIVGQTFQFLAEVQHRSNGGGPCGTPTATPTFTPTATATATFTPTATATATASIHADSNGDCDSDIYCNGYGNCDSNCNGNGNSNCDHTAAAFTDATATADTAGACEQLLCKF